MTKRYLFLGTACCVLLTQTPCVGKDPLTLPEVGVQGTLQKPSEILIDLQDALLFPSRDGGEYLQSLPGVSGVRMGGHGTDPVIRGMQQGRLSLIDDGLAVHGGCPNRMDPPSSFLSLEGSDELIVQKGYQSVEHGPGRPGGTVKTKRVAPIFAQDEKAIARVQGGYDSNGVNRDLSFDTSINLSQGDYLRAQLDYKEAKNYQDGQGRSVRSAFQTEGGRFDVGIAGPDDQRLTLGIQYDNTTDALFAGAGMDAPKAQMKGLRARLEGSVDLGYFQSVEASAYLSDVDHEMDNFTLRARTGNGRLTDSDTRTWGGKFALHHEEGGQKQIIGTDLKLSSFDAVRYFGAQNTIINRPGTSQEANMWPGLSLLELGVFGEHEQTLSEQNTLKVGVRYDLVRATASKNGDISAVTGRSANDLYQTYYGYGWDDQTEHNLGGLIRLDHRFQDGFEVYGSVSRSVRTADANERAIAGDANMVGMRWVGNPDIEPEQHHQVELGSHYTQDQWSIGGSVYYNKVKDFILRDQDFGQDGILTSTGSVDIYRNVDATLMGFEIEGQIDLTSDLNVSTNLAYTRGENDEDNTPLAQIAPLEVTTSVEYSQPDWMAGLRMRAAAKQSRADVGTNNSGLDQEETGGYAVFDLYGKIWTLEPFEIALGASNIFDKTYSNHLNRASNFDTEVVKVNEPGQSFFVRINASF